MNDFTRHGLSLGYYLLNLVFELKFLNVFMIREEPVEFNILIIEMEEFSDVRFKQLLLLNS
jgi:hypothetical protein